MKENIVFTTYSYEKDKKYDVEIKWKWEWDLFIVEKALLGKSLDITNELKELEWEKLSYWVNEYIPECNIITWETRFDMLTPKIRWKLDKYFKE